MSKRSNVSPGVVLKSLRRMASHPWILGKLFKLQGEKWLFNQLNPQAPTGRARRIHQLSIRITDVCNLRCHTCGQWGDHGFLRGQDLGALKRQEVSPDRHLELFSDLVQHGHHPNVYIWGGEPMLYKGTLEVIEGASRLGLPTSIVSNGHRVAGAVERLVKAPLFLMQISVDGHNAQMHNQARPSAGSGDAFSDVQSAMEAINRARRDSGGGLPLIASLTVVSANNINHLVDIYRAFKDQVDLFVFYLSWWITQERAEAHDQDFQRRFGFAPRLHWGWLGDWQPDDYAALQDQIDQLNAISRPWNAPPVTFIPSISGLDNLRQYYTDHSSRFGFDQCISIFQAVELDSNGNMSPCRDYHDYVVGNVKEQTITQLWNSPAYRKFRSSLHTEGLMPACSRCCGLMGY